MSSVVETPRPLLSSHVTLGSSTGYMTEERGNWPTLVRESLDVSTLAVELSALSEEELPGLVEFLEGDPPMPFHYVSVHAPSKNLTLSEQERVEQLASLPPRVRAIVVHPYDLSDLDAWRPLGRRLVIENMDARKDEGQTAGQLARYFDELPEAGLCFDVAHAKHVDPSLDEGVEMLSAFAPRLRHVHLSSLDHDGHHIPLTSSDEALFAPVLAKCRDVPWILEAPLP